MEKGTIIPKMDLWWSWGFCGSVGGGVLQEVCAALHGQWPPAHVLPLAVTEHYAHSGIKLLKDQQPLETIWKFL